MNKRVILLVILVLSLTMIFAGCTSGGATIQNGDFSSFDEKAGEFGNWQRFYDADKPGDFKPHFAPVDSSESIEDKGHGTYVEINAGSYGVNYMYQVVSLKKGVTYKLSADFKTFASINGENSSKYRAAYVGFLEDASFAVEVKGSTQGKWINKSGYFTPATSKDYTLVVAIGHPTGGKAKGLANFDNIKLETIEAGALPPNEVVHTIKHGTSPYTLADGSSVAFVVVGAILSVFIVAMFMYLYRKTMSREMLSAKKMLSPIALFIYMMVVAFVIRFLLAFFTGGMTSEIASLTQVALKFNSSNITGVMFATSTLLPAGMLYLLGGLNGIANLLHIGGDGFALLIRLPFILADLVAIYMIYSIVSTRQKEHTAIFVAGLYAVLPAIIMASTGWGMVISLVGCLLIGMYYCMLKKNYIGVTSLYTVALLFSNYVVLLLPLVLAFYINSFMKYQDSRLKIGLGALVSFIVFYAVTVPFVVNYLSKGQPFYYFSTMFRDLTSVVVLTVDAFNLYGIFGLNMAEIPVALNVLNYIFVIGLMILTVLIYVKNRDRLNIILMSAFTLIAISTFSVRGDLKLMVLGVMLLFLYAAIANSRRAYALVGGFGTLSFINMALIMSNSGFISNQLNASATVHFFATDASLIVFSIISVLLTCYMGYVVYDVCVRERVNEIPPLDGKLKDDIRTRIELFKNRKANRVAEETQED